MKKTTPNLAKAALALALATGSTALYAQETGTPDTSVPSEPAPPPAEPAPPPPAEPAPPPPADPAPAPVDENGDGIDDASGEPIADEGAGPNG